MSDTIKIKKGLDLPIHGEAELRVTEALNIRTYAVQPTDFVGLVPRLKVAEGDKVTAGTPLFQDKNNEKILFTSPVNGQVKAVVRGEKRKLLAVIVETTEDVAPAQTNTVAAPANREALVEKMLECGAWTMLRQRPFGIVANPDTTPKAIFVSCFDSAPLAIDTDFVMKGREKEFEAGVKALAMLTNGKVHLSFRPDQQLAKVNLTGAQIEKHFVSGPHPAGNIGTQMAAIDPINKGEIVWTMNVQDVAVLGHLMLTGEYRPERMVAVVGPEAKNPQYYHVMAGACLETLLKGQNLEGTRVISGNVLSGTQTTGNGYVGAYDSMISLLEEGNYYDFMGWLMPGLKKFSFSRTFASGFVCSKSRKKVLGTPNRCLTSKFDTSLHGAWRPQVVTGSFERVFPFDIYPTQLLKACIIGDIELMENLGIYEVEPEDFALCEFIDTSKTDIQPIIREALELLRKEAM